MVNKTQSKAILSGNILTGSFISREGETIGYRQLGHGPGLVVLHGAASSGYNHIQLASLLADAFTVTLQDRGRGLSDPFGKDYSIQTEVDDLELVLTKTGARYVFGVSSGAIVTLQAALSLPGIQKIAIYEPPLLVRNAARELQRFDNEMAQGRVAAAMVTAMKGAQMGPAIFNVLPNCLLERLTNMMMAGEEKNPSGEYVTMRLQAATMHFDSQLVVEMAGKMESFCGISAEVLLMGGSKSPKYLKDGLDALEKILPRAKRVEFHGLGHAASWNSERGGSPEAVARELRKFFLPG